MKKFIPGFIRVVGGWIFRQVFIALVQMLLPFEDVRDFFDDSLSGQK